MFNLWTGDHLGIVLIVQPCQEGPCLLPSTTPVVYVQTEHVIYCQSSAYQTALTAIIKEALSNPLGTQGLKGINNSMMELRIISNHPLIR